ncbi:TPA: carbohydrate porin [Enterobacter hormaechei subsp. steigerwaltii]|nr:carbohydrate porin [Enterobacter hormaechei subsp. steigerwaltii]HDT0965514.1 carbohydrate porin [Enterobacter hormaechei subsp. steigerwaltii]
MTVSLQNKIFLMMASPFLFSFASYAAEKTPAWSPTVLGYEPMTPGLLGDWGGIRSTLSDNGFNYALIYQTESAYNVSGGYDKSGHFAFVDQTALLFTQDLERLTGMSDAKIEGLITNRNHDDNLTTERLQDQRVHFNDLAQEGWGTGSITRLGYLTFSRTFMDQKLTWRAGLMNYQQTFDQITPCDFQLLTLCGGKSSNSLTWNTWNIHSWGTTLAYAITPELTIKTGVIEQNPRAADTSRAWSFTTHGSKGVLLPVEAELKTHVNGLPGAYNLGILFTNAKQYSLYTPVGEETESYNRTWFAWAGFNQQVTSHQDDKSRGMSVFGNMSLADQRTDVSHIVASLGVRYRGLFDAMPNDYIGFGGSWIDMSNRLAKTERQINQINGIYDYDNPLYQPVQGHAINFDLYYRFRPVSWLDIQPDVQYWINPAAVSETKNAFVVGIKTAIRF